LEVRDMADTRVKGNKATLKLEGMSCASCAQAIETALNKADGVASARENFAAEKAYVDFDPSRVDKRKLAEIVRDTGYDVKEDREKATLKIGGMTCASCAATVENALKKAEGIYSAGVNIATEKATIEYDPTLVDREKLAKIVYDSGYDMLGVEGEQKAEAGQAAEDEDGLKHCDSRVGQRPFR
jgi:Cu+-exporting ATPase